VTVSTVVRTYFFTQIDDVGNYLAFAKILINLRGCLFLLEIKKNGAENMFKYKLCFDFLLISLDKERHYISIEPLSETELERKEGLNLSQSSSIFF